MLLKRHQSLLFALLCLSGIFLYIETLQNSTKAADPKEMLTIENSVKTSDRDLISTKMKWFVAGEAPCGLRGSKNRPAPFPGRMSYKATKPGSVCPVS